MENAKILKAVCRKTNKHFGLEIKQFGSSWRVVNFIPLSTAEANVITSEIRQTSFSTNENLRACASCGSRVVGSCDCAQKRYNCNRSNEFNFQCIYCKNLEIDYSAPILGSGQREGDVIHLSQGQVVKISSGGRPLSKIYVGVGWDPVRQGYNMDIDSSVVVAGGYEREVVYFGDLAHPSGCVIHHGDNLTGEDKYDSNDDENITVFLNKVPANRDRLIFVLNIYECLERNQQFGDVRNMYIRLYDPDSRRMLVEYRINGNMQNFTALVVGMAYRQGNEWMFKAIGTGSYAADIGELADEVMGIR